jgi:hypothetical protein
MATDQQQAQAAAQQQTDAAKAKADTETQQHRAQLDAQQQAASASHDQQVAAANAQHDAQMQQEAAQQRRSFALRICGRMNSVHATGLSMPARAGWPKDRVCGIASIRSMAPPCSKAKSMRTSPRSSRAAVTAGWKASLQ